MFYFTEIWCERALLVHGVGLLINAENDWWDGWPQVAVHC